MLTRPLDLASRLRPPPRNFDLLFFVNGGLLVLFFLMFGSRFVLAPGLGLNFQLQTMPGARGGAAQTTHRVTVKPSGAIFTEQGPAASLADLTDWLKKEAKKTRQPSLLIIASKDVPQGKIVEIASIAAAAGFTHVQEAAEEPIPENH